MGSHRFVITLIFILNLFFCFVLFQIHFRIIFSVCIEKSQKTQFEIGKEHWSSEKLIDFHYFTGLQEKEHFDGWELKKSILNTLFQAVKAITGGVTAIKGQLIKGSGYALSHGGKVKQLTFY